MRFGGCFELILFLAAASVVNSQSEAPTTEDPRNYLFVKPRNFVLHPATNKTRFTAEEKAQIVQIHNAYRSLVLPPATNMQELVWDDDLEEYAWNTTQACTGAHSAGTMLKKYRPQFPDTWKTLTAMGEVLYYRNGQYYSFEEALWMFWAEGIDYDIVNHECTPGKECGHYRVMTLAASGGVGCAINVCNNFSVSRYPTPSVFLSCSYDGQYLIYYKPYKVGERGSDCKKLGYDYEYYRNGLCISPERYWNNKSYDGNTSVVGLPSPYLTTSTITPATTTATTSSSSSQPNTTEPQETSETITTTTLGTESSTPSTLETTDSSVKVTTRKEDNTSIIITTSTMETETSESTTLTSTTQKTASGGDTTTCPPTSATDTTESLTYTSTKHTRSVNRSCRSCTSASELVLLLFALAIFDYIFNLT
ncbi:unnamed protein product [Candidula unifasciata]|uniref:SCP domain-containing protein n=1 Tax=Candidula unifasciata TaxID=100452 RepID=A0A8S3YMW2_9EUPU|nr:unnamed protein product [Candidula unifasciata]